VPGSGPGTGFLVADRARAWARARARAWARVCRCVGPTIGPRADHRWSAKLKESWAVWYLDAYSEGRGARRVTLARARHQRRRRPMQNQLVMYEEEVRQLYGVCETLSRDSNARAVLVIGKDGQPIANAGDVDQLDVTSLSSLTAGNVAATGGIASAARREGVRRAVPRGREDQHPHLPRRAAGHPVIICTTSALRSAWCACACERPAWRSPTSSRSWSRRRGREPTVGVRRDHRRRHRQPLRRRLAGAMSFINYSSREINCKIVYYGPGLCGKTTNFSTSTTRPTPKPKAR
jgi:hypothetical protein